MSISTVIALPEVSTVVELPEVLHNRAVAFVKDHKQWSYDRLVAAALVLFLANQGN